MSTSAFLGAVTSAALLFAHDVATAQGITIYFVRHAEDEVALVEPGKDARALLRDCRPFLNEGEIDECCLEVLDSVGEIRAALLAAWFKDQGTLPGITHLFGTHKERTRQTLLPTARAAGLAPDLNGDGQPDGSDVDKNPGDGVQQIPPFVEECEKGFEIAHNFFQLVVDELSRLPDGSVAVVSGHSASVYPLMEAFGIDTSDPKKFPRTAVGRVRGFNNLWEVHVEGGQHGVLLRHLQLDFTLATKPSP